MSLIKKNITANLVKNIWQALMALIFIPLYIKFMGVESYGLVGIYATLQAIFFLLDLGLSNTLNRELARLSVLPGKEQEMRNLVKTLEYIYWSIAIFIGITTIVIGPFIAKYWLNSNQLPIKTVEHAIRIMGFALALQFPASIYIGGFMGLQKQVLLGGITMGMGTFRGAGAVLILWLVSPTIYAYFSWQILSSVLNTFLLSVFLWKNLPRTNKKAVFQKKLLIGFWRFAVGMSGISILSIILTQMDKVILSKMLTLEMFGYYTLAGVVALSLYRLISPIFSAIYPRFTQLISLNDQNGLTSLYHKSSQLMSVLILPVTVIISMFSYEILLIWTQNPVTAEKTHILASILICGTALNGLMNVPYALQLASGWVKLTFYINLASVILLVPLMIYLTNLYGAIGGASVWLILNVGYVLAAIQIMHKRLLTTEKWKWYAQDIGLPLLISLSVAILGRLFMKDQMSQFMTVSYLFLVSFITLGSTAVLTKTTRTWMLNKVVHFKMEFKA